MINSFVINKNPEVWVNYEYVNGLLWRLTLTTSPIGEVIENEGLKWLVLELLDGKRISNSIPHYKPKGISGKILAWLSKNINRGKVTSYKHLAMLFNMSPRAIGAILKYNRLMLIYPCHRVVMSDGRLGGFTDVSIKKWLLTQEGIEIEGEKIPRRFFVR